MWYDKCRSECTSENTGDRRLGGLSLVRTLGLPGADQRVPYRSCYHCPILTPDFHPFIFLRRLLFALLNVIGGLGVRPRRNRGEERQKLVLKCVKVKTQELLRVFLMPTLRRKLSQMLAPVFPCSPLTLILSNRFLALIASYTLTGAKESRSMSSPSSSRRFLSFPERGLNSFKNSMVPVVRENLSSRGFLESDGEGPGRYLASSVNSR